MLNRKYILRFFSPFSFKCSIWDLGTAFIDLPHLSLGRWQRDTFWGSDLHNVWRREFSELDPVTTTKLQYISKSCWCMLEGIYIGGVTMSLLVDDGKGWYDVLPLEGTGYFICWAVATFFGQIAVISKYKTHAKQVVNMLLAKSYMHVAFIILINKLK